MPLKLISNCLACLGFAAFAAPLCAHPVLTFTVASRVEPPPGQSQKPSEETFPLIVTLGHRFLSIEAKGTRTIYDFEHYRIRRLNLGARTFEDDSLYADVGFRVLEFYNRMQLGSAMRSANIDGSSAAVQHFDVALVENLFSLTDEKSHTAIDTHKEKGAMQYLWQQHTLMTVSDRATPLPPARDKLSGDAQVMRVVAALGKHDASQAPRIADEFASLRALSPSHIDVLDIFEGNTRLEMRQGPQGTELLLAAARADPYLTGAWHDLGDYYYRSFKMPEAWACLDAARRIAPADPMLRPANNLEQALRTKNPEFF
jgi:hypothetical protein